jgi:hypothetical protein
MLLPLLLLAAAQAAAPPATPHTVQRAGKPFMSPMGEPVFGRHHRLGNLEQAVAPGVRYIEGAAS